MTPEQKAEYKQEVKTALYEYLEINNLIESRNDEIMSHLQNMYRHLEEKNLIKYGLTFPFFASMANDAFMMALIRGIE